MADHLKRIGVGLFIAGLLFLNTMPVLSQSFPGLLATDRLLGRDSAGTGQVEQLTVGGAISFTGTAGITVTAASILSNLLTVDGAGSGLDADLLDGITSADFLTEAEAAAAYQPLDSDLTSWAAITRAAGFDTFVATPSMANLGSLLTDDASGWTTFGTTPSMANLGTLLTDEATGWITFGTTASSANFAALVTGETGTGAVVFGTSPGFTTAANPVSNDGAALGETSTPLRWSDLFMADGAVINMGLTASRATITHTAASDSIVIAADPDNATATSQVIASVDGTNEFILDPTNLTPGANDGNALGVDATRWADLFLADGGVVNLGASGSRATITHSSASDSITIAADPDNATATSQVVASVDGTNELILDPTNLTPGANDGNALGVTGTRWADVFTADGSVIDMGASGSRATITHTSASDSITIAADPDNATATSQVIASVDGANELILDGTNLTPGANDGNALGVSGTAWADLFLAAGGLIEFNGATDSSLTCSSGTCTVEGVGVVRGATGATDNSILRADGTGGTLLQNSVLVIADTSGAISGAASGFLIEFFGAAGTDTTLTAPSAGDLNIEGNRIYRAGGTDVALADGGTGASLSDPNADRILWWDDSAGAVVTTDLLSLATEAAPAAGDYLVLVDAAGVESKVNWSSLPGAGGGISNVVEDVTPQLGGDLDANTFWILFDDATGIKDESGNEQIVFQTTASAVNQFDITNSAANGVQRIEATGGDAAIAVTIASKSTDPINLEINGGTETTLNATNFNPGADGGNSLGASGTEWLAASIDTVTVTTLELGGAATTDTSLTRSAAGVLAVEGNTVPATPNVQTMTATGSGDSWDKPTGGQKMCEVKIWGGGGSGGKGNAAQAAGGGGGGAYVTKLYVMSDLAATETVNVATGGAAQTTNDTDGNVGGDTVFSSGATIMTAYGGGAGDGDSTAGGSGGGGGGHSLAGGAGSSTIGGNTDGASNANWAPYGTSGGDGIATGNGSSGRRPNWGGAGGGGSTGDATGTNGAGGSTQYGGAGGGAGAEDAAPGPGAGGSSVYGGNGGAGAFDANVATNGTQPAGGGGGSETGNSGKGGDGKAVITCW